MAKALPEDLISPIVANFGDGNPILATCALVCRSWYLPSQALRFRSVELLRYEPCSSLNRLLQSSPHIASFVKSFSFSPTMIAFTRPSVSLRGGGHIGDIDNLLHILSRLTQIQHLEIRGEKTIWHKFPQVLRVSIQTTVQLPSLVSLKLSYWLFFEGGIELQDLLQHFSSLRKLELNRIAVLATPPVPIMPREPIVSSLRLHHRLAWLCIDGCGGLQDWLFASGCVVELKDISQLWLSRLSPIITSRILKSSSSSLQSLGIRVMDPLGDCLDLSQFTNLLYFDFSASVNALTTLAMLVWLESAISTLPTDNHLDQLVLRFAFLRDRPYADLTAQRLLPSLSKLCSTLTSPKFHLLRSIRVIQCLHGSPSVFDDTVREAFACLGSKLAIQNSQTGSWLSD